MLTPTKERPVAILGGGIAGLTAACHLRHHGVPFVLFEGSPAIAGLMKSDRDEEGFTYDSGVHFLTNRLAAAVGISKLCRPMHRYGETVYVRGKMFSYPLGLMLSPRYLGSAIQAKFSGIAKKSAQTAREHYCKSYGRSLAEEIALPLTEAWSGFNGDEIASSVGQKFTTSLPRMLMLRTAAKMTNRVIGIGYATAITESTNSWHVYPEGGVANVCHAQASKVKDSILLNTKVTDIFVKNNRVVSVKAGNQEIPVSAVISTAPVHALAGIVRGTDKLDYLKRFKYRAMIFVNLKIEGASGLTDVVTWVPEERYRFFRVSDIGLGLPWLVPEGKAQITCDIGCSVGDDYWNSSDEQLIELCKAEMEMIVPGFANRCFGGRVVRVPLAYPIYKLEYEQDRCRFQKGTEINGLISVGRNGEFSHILMEDVFWRTRWKVSQLLNYARSEV